MSDFEEILVSETGFQNGRWKTSRLGNWLYIIDGWQGDNGQIYSNKSKAGNPFQIRVNVDNLDGFVDHVKELKERVDGGDSGSSWSEPEQDQTKEDDDVPF